MTTISKSLDNGYTLELQLTETSVDSINNTSTISWALVLKSTDANFTTYKIGWNVQFNNSIISQQAWSTAQSRSINKYSSLTISSGTATVTHNQDGTMNMAVSASITMSRSSYAPINGSSGQGTVSMSGSMALTPISNTRIVITSCTAYRCDSSGVESSNGTYLRLYCVARIDGSGTVSISYSTSKPESGSLTSGTPIILSGYSTSNTYSVNITVYDGDGHTSSRSFNISTGLVTFHMKAGGKAAAFSKYATEDNTVDFGIWSPIGYVIGLKRAKARLQNIDLDDIIEPGVYSVYQDLDISSTGHIDNCPSSHAGTLRVWNALGWGENIYYILQEYIDWQANIWIRRIFIDSNTQEKTTYQWKKIAFETS